MIYHMDLKKISSLKFLKSPAVLPYWSYLMITFDITHGLLKFLKSPAVAVFIGDISECQL